MNYWNSKHHKETFLEGDSLSEINGKLFIPYRDAHLFVEGEEVNLLTPTVYPDKDGLYVGGTYIAEHENIIVIGSHGCNPNGYKYLEKVVIIDVKKKTSKIIKLYNFLSLGNAELGGNYNSPLSQLSEVTYKNNKFYVASECGKKVSLDAEGIMKEPIAINKTATAFWIESNDFSKLENLFEVEIFNDGNDALFKLKKEVSRLELLKFTGFTLEYDLFKLDSLYDKVSYFTYMDSNNFQKKVRISWDNTRVFNTEDAPFKVARQLIRALAKIIPQHPYILRNPNDFFIEKVAG